MEEKEKIRYQQLSNPLKISVIISWGVGVLYILVVVGYLGIV